VFTIIHVARNLTLDYVNSIAPFQLRGAQLKWHKDRGLIKTEFLIFESPAEQGFQKLSFGVY
jgi:hypothetical protein